MTSRQPVCIDLVLIDYLLLPKHLHAPKPTDSEPTQKTDRTSAAVCIFSCSLASERLNVRVWHFGREVVQVWLGRALYTVLLNIGTAKSTAVKKTLFAEGLYLELSRGKQPKCVPYLSPGALLLVHESGQQGST